MPLISFRTDLRISRNSPDFTLIYFVTFSFFLFGLTIRKRVGIEIRRLTDPDANYKYILIIFGLFVQ